jgi:hypothetical protein
LRRGRGRVRQRRGCWTPASVFLQPAYGYGNEFDVVLNVVLEGIAARLSRDQH